MESEIGTSVIERVDRLEKDNVRLGRQMRLLKLLACMLGVALLMIVCMGGTPKQSDNRLVKAERIEIYDRDGNVRGSIGMDAGGACGLQLMDSDGRLRGRFMVYENGAPGLTFLNEDGRNQAQLGVYGEETILTFWDIEGAERLSIGAGLGGDPRLLMEDRAGTVIYSVP
jgi:hypothetical protein